MITQEARNLLLAITRCPVAEATLRGGRSRARADIVGVQGVGLEEFQIPEPWSGHLATAPVLFLGSNPGYAVSEEYPRRSWSDEEIVDFFENRFGGGRREWVKAGRYTLLQTGEHKERWVRYWAAVRRRAGELLGRDATPGVDYAISEVVHCKSAHERGVGSALEECVPRYLECLISASGARVVVCLGRVADRAVREKWGIADGVAVHGPVEVGGRPRLFAFLPHPNARGERSFAACVSGEDLGRLRAAVGSDTPS